MARIRLMQEELKEHHTKKGSFGTDFGRQAALGSTP